MSTLNSEFAIPDIYLKHSLDKHNVYYNLLKIISDKIIAIPEFQKLKTETELVKLVSNLVENSVPKGQKIDKKQLVIEIFQRVFNLNVVEQEILKNTIEFLFNNKLIKKISYKKYIYNNSFFFF